MNIKKSLLYVTVPLLFISCAKSSTDKNSDLEKNKAVVLEYHDIWNGGNIDQLDDILTSDFVCHYLTSEEWKGIDEAKKNISDWRALCPDWKEEIEDVIQENDKVVTRYKAIATHTQTY